jgi:hypothetical protein
MAQKYKYAVKLTGDKYMVHHFTSKSRAIQFAKMGGRTGKVLTIKLEKKK